jgi:TolB-like protein/tetratricopeptide (TPR) repeat protein
MVPSGEVAPRLAVLSFENPSGDPEQDYFARGFVEDVVTELSRFPTLEVIHPHTSFALTGSRLPDALPVGYLLQGSVRRLGDTVRIAVQLVGADSGRQIWADRFDAPAERLFAVQDQIVARVASTLAIQIDGARLHRARRKPLASLEVYDCWLRGLDCLRRGTAEDDERARQFFERALTLDPHWARGHAGISLSHFNEWSCQAWELWDEKERLAFDHAQRAVDLDDRDALIQIVLGRILLYRRQFEEAARHVDRATDLNPNDADVLAHAALCRAYLGDAQSAIGLAAKAVRLNPYHPDWYLYCAALPLFLQQRYAEVVAQVSKAPQAMVDLPAYLAASHALMGEPARAAACLETFLSDFVEKIAFGRPAEPGEPLRWLLHVNPFRRLEDADLLIRGLRLAGLPADPDERAVRAVPQPRNDASLHAVFRREGGLWTLAFDGAVVQLTEAKGFHDLAELLARPEARIHCLELAGRSTEPRGDDPVLDARARQELGARARELEEEIDEADRLNDRGRAERAREELDHIVTALADALGLGGRSRRLGSAAERARSAVTWRLRNAIRKIATAHPGLGRHLDNTIRTGTYCAYTPDKPVDWVL